MPLLLHSLGEFAPLIRSLLAAVKPERVVEIGGEAGESARAYLEAGASQIVCVDPAPGPELTELADHEERMELVVERSPDCLPRIPASPFWVIDGDHNYATVRAELESILARPEHDAGCLILLHDVLWPWARRDLYYDPSGLTPTTVHPHDWDTGPTVFSDKMQVDGFVGLGQFAAATEAGGERNGVRTAVEDVLESRPRLAFAIVPAVFGLGVVYDRDAPWASEVTSLLKPWDRSPLLTRLELNRIALYSRVLMLKHELAQLRRQHEGQARELDAQIAELRSERLTLREQLTRQ